MNTVYRSYKTHSMLMCYVKHILDKVSFSEIHFELPSNAIHKSVEKPSSISSP